MIGWVLETALALDPERVIVVVGHGREEVEAQVRAEFPDAPIRFVVQEEQLGTGHAVECASAELEGFDGPVLVLCGDTPLLKHEGLQALLAARESRDAVSMLSAYVPDPTGYGRVVRDEEDVFARIVEERDASSDERRIAEINLGVYAFGAADLLAYLARVGDQNAQGERYLPDVLGMYTEEGRVVEVVELEDAEEDIMMGGDEGIMILIGETFVQVDEEEANEYVETKREKYSAKVAVWDEELAAIEDRQKELKKLLYGRFGKSINLEE